MALSTIAVEPKVIDIFRQARAALDGGAVRREKWSQIFVHSREGNFPREQHQS